MPLPTFHLRLTGYVGSATFNRDITDRVLTANAGKHVDVMIESYGGSLATGLSIASALKAHGDATVYFRGMNASAATIASLGAKKIIIDSNAMYLVHKVSVEFFEWAQLNSDGMAQLVEELSKTRGDLDTFDRNIATMYASKCRKSCKEMLTLMGKETWLTAQEALDWGFVDEIHEVVGNPKARLTDTAAAAMAAAGTPLPPVDVTDDTRSPIGKAIRFIETIFRRLDTTSEEYPTNDTDTMETNSVQPTVPATEATAVPATEQPQAAAQPAEEQNDVTSELERLRAENARLREAMSHRPADGTSQVVASRASAAGHAAAYAGSVQRARSLMDELNKIF